MKRGILILFFCVLSIKAAAQDFIRIGASHDFYKDKIVQTFSFDFNRTEKVDEKAGKALLFYNDFYIIPTADVNIGDGVTSSENNVLAQIAMGKGFFKDPIQSQDKPLNHRTWNYMIEANPSYNSDKLFEEKLFYGQVKLLANVLFTTHDTQGVFVRYAHNLTGGAFSNLGYRYSKVYIDNEYITLGILLDYTTQLFDMPDTEKWVLKLSGNYYYIASDIDELTTDDYGGIVKASIDRRVYKNIYIGVSYKYGNDNPKYAYVNTLEASFKIKYL